MVFANKFIKLFNLGAQRSREIEVTAYLFRSPCIPLRRSHSPLCCKRP